MRWVWHRLTLLFHKKAGRETGRVMGISTAYPDAGLSGGFSAHFALGCLVSPQAESGEGVRGVFDDGCQAVRGSSKQSEVLVSMLLIDLWIAISVTLRILI